MSVTIMKYNTIGTSNFFTDGKKSKFAIYADTDLAREKMNSYEAEMASVRGQLELVQNALKLQTRRCRQLVAEYTKRFQVKEEQFQVEKQFREEQLAQVLRALLVLEARLKQEQKYISHQLKEKDYIIKKQQTDIQRILSNTYCKNCNQYYSESLDSSSEYVVTDYHSSTFESLDSGSETYASMSEKDSPKVFNNCNVSVSSEDSIKLNSNRVRSIFAKNKHNGSLGRNAKPFIQRNSIGEYSDTLNRATSETEEGNHYDEVSSPIDKYKSNTSSELSLSEASSNVTTCATALNITNTSIKSLKSDTVHSERQENNQINSVTLFEGDVESNDNWYTSTSDQEDDEQRGIYRNNPVLECMNEILLQNMNDPLVSPPKSPDAEKKSNKHKRVKFEETNDSNVSSSGYYETPIQKTPNFYETPQSTYSNDYEQILSQFGENSADKSAQEFEAHHKILNISFVKDKCEIPIAIVRKSKILRTPPALPPKPNNLVVTRNKSPASSKLSDKSCDSEPDYCSISEINLPTTDKLSFMKINVVAEINLPKMPETSPVSKQNDANEALNKNSPKIENEKVSSPTDKSSPFSKQPPTPTKLQDIPKLPHVTEIIIPDDEVESSTDSINVTQDNYVANNTQSKHKVVPDRTRIHPIQMGSTVSTLIASFNKKQISSEMQQKPKVKQKIDKRLFSSFENLQDLDSPHSPQKFDLSHNFEEFNLDECEISEYTDNMIECNMPNVRTFSEKRKNSSTCVEMVRATKDSTSTPFNTSPLQQLKKKLEIEKHKVGVQKMISSNEPTYEHFLECTGLSSKSILSPSRHASTPKILKLKDVKLRSKTKSNIFDKQNGTIKYWSEPFL